MATDLARSIRPDEAASLASSIVRVLGRERASRELMVSDAALDAIEGGRLDQVSDVTIVDRVTAWATGRTADLFRATGGPIPPFNHLEDFWVNFYEGPRWEPVPRLERKPTRSKLLDFELTFPFGVPACALTPHSRYIEFFSQRGFDLLTYKTVRDRAWNPFPFPQWAFAVDAPERLTSSDFDRPVVATLDPGTQPDRRAVLANSFGVPSLAPDEWQRDVEETKRRLLPGQILIVSIMGTPEEAGHDAELARQFARTAAMARDAGADVVEANLSCPNTGSGELICQSPDASAAVVQAIADQLRRSGTPLFIKISHLEPPALSDLVRRCAPSIQGVVAINTVSVPVVTRSGEQFFIGRERAGLSGATIRSLALDVTRQLVEQREREFNRSDFVVIGVGGVTVPSDFDDFREVGVDAVQSCSGAWLNPGLAAEIQTRGSSSMPRSTEVQSTGSDATEEDQLALLAALREGDGRDPIELAAATQLSPSSARVAVRALEERGWASRHERNVVLTATGRRALADIARHGVFVTSGDRVAAPDIDQELDRAIARLESR